MSDVVATPQGAEGGTITGAAGAAAAPGALPLAERLSDRLNPILLREVQQALNGRAFLITVFLALLGMVVVALSFAGGGDLQLSTGRNALTVALMILTPMVGLIVPFIAFLSMRQEVSSGTVEHLMLSRLTPGSVVRGKLAAAIVQIVVVISLFAPLLALTWLLRGVDVGTIAALLTLALLGGIAAVSVGICGGALCRWPPARAILVVILALGFTILSLVTMVGMWFLVGGVSNAISRPDFRWLRAFGMLVPIAAGIGLLTLTAASALTHPNENRSTGFRLYALLAVAVLYAWMAWLVLDPSARRGGWTGGTRVHSDAPEVALGLAFATFFFWLFAVTEEERLSPRVHAHVPRSRVLALLVSPLLPGGGRGLLFVLLLAGLTLLGAERLPWWVDGRAPSTQAFAEAAAAWAYVVFYAGLGRFLRGRMSSGTRGSVMARFALPLAILLLALLPSVVDLLASGRTGDWNALYATNPFATLFQISAAHRGIPGFQVHAGAAYAPWILAGLGLALNVPALVRGVTEVLAASKARRARAS